MDRQPSWRFQPSTSNPYVPSGPPLPRSYYYQPPTYMPAPITMPHYPPPPIYGPYYAMPAINYFPFNASVPSSLMWAAPNEPNYSHATFSPMSPISAPRSSVYSPLPAITDLRPATPERLLIEQQNSYKPQQTNSEEVVDAWSPGKVTPTTLSFENTNISDYDDLFLENEAHDANSNKDDEAESMKNDITMLSFNEAKKLCSQSKKKGAENLSKYSQSMPKLNDVGLDQHAGDSSAQENSNSLVKKAADFQASSLGPKLTKRSRHSLAMSDDAIRRSILLETGEDDEILSFENAQKATAAPRVAEQLATALLAGKQARSQVSSIERVWCAGQYGGHIHDVRFPASYFENGGSYVVGTYQGTQFHVIGSDYFNRGITTMHLQAIVQDYVADSGSITRAILPLLKAFLTVPEAFVFRQQTGAFAIPINFRQGFVVLAQTILQKSSSAQLSLALQEQVKQAVGRKITDALVNLRRVVIRAIENGLPMPNQTHFTGVLVSEEVLEAFDTATAALRTKRGSTTQMATRQTQKGGKKKIIGGGLETLSRMSRAGSMDSLVLDGGKGKSKKRGIDDDPTTAKTGAGDVMFWPNTV